MSNELRSKFRDRKRSYIKKKELTSFDERLYVKVPKLIIGIPLVGLGILKNKIDSLNDSTTFILNKEPENKCTIFKNISKIETKIYTIKNKDIRKIGQIDFLDDPNKDKKEIKVIDRSLQSVKYKSEDNKTTRQENKFVHFNSIKNVEKRGQNQKGSNKNDSEKIDLEISKIKESNIDENKSILEKKIIKKIKKKIEKAKNQLEILSSEFYALKEIYNDEDKKRKCKDQIKLINELLMKIEKIKHQYDILNGNYDFEEILDLDDNDLIEDIINYKKLADKYEESVSLTKGYKKIDGFLTIYKDIDIIDGKVKSFEQEKRKRLIEQQMRDDEFICFQNKLVASSNILIEYNNTLNKQSKILLNLGTIVGKIDSREEITYKWNGFSDLLIQSFKYVGLLAISPLSGLLPSIAINTIATRKMIKNLSNSLELEEIRKTIYSSRNYDEDIRNSLCNLGDVNNLISYTLKDIRNLKEKFNSKFSKYKYKFSKYEESINKLNMIENKLLSNQRKIKLMKEKLEINKKINSDKLIRVKKLNSLK